MKNVWILLVVLTGCLGSPVREQWGPVLFMGGVHFVRSAEDSVIAEGYLINTRATTFDLTAFALSVLLMGSEDEITPAKQVPSGRNWHPGEVRKWSAIFADSPREPQKVFVGVNGEPYWDYVTLCRDTQGVVVNDAECPGFVQRLELTEETEGKYVDVLLKCCDWVPPQLNIHGLDCRVVINAATLACEGNVTNFRQEGISVTAEAVLTEAKLAPGEGQHEISRYPLSGVTFAGNSTSAYQFEAPIDAAALAEPGHSYSMELRLANSQVPRSVANETSILVIAQTSEGIS